MDDQHAEGVLESCSTGGLESCSTGVLESCSTGGLESCSTGTRKRSSASTHKSCSTSIKKSCSTGGLEGCLTDNTMNDTVTQARQEREKQGGLESCSTGQNKVYSTHTCESCATDNNMNDTVTQAIQEREKQGDKMADTVAMAKMERAKQGPCEVEISYGGEADLHKHVIGCEKNPDHLKFVPVDKFTVDDLPTGDHGHRNHLFDLVRAVSDLTVRVSVTYVSNERPKIIPGTDISYPCYSDRGSKMLRTGTGLVSEVNKFTDCSDDNSSQNQDRQNSPTQNTCPCSECENSATPKTQFAFIYIRTSAHVVFDDLEADHTTCHLFFNREGTPDHCDDVVALSGMSVVWSAEARDVCEMRHVTHDLDLADRLSKMVEHWDDFGESFYKFDRLESEMDQTASLVEESSDKMAIIVSHPHGCSKQVSVGDYMGRDDINGTLKLSILSPIKYSTATCPGSSGALLIVVKNGRFFYWANNLVHFGVCESNKDFNRSCRFFA